MTMPETRPLVFACSGCSNAGQLTNQVAVELQRRGFVEMSCLAGLGAGKRHFLDKLKCREVWAIDGCPIECGLGVFSHIEQYVDVHVRLHDFGIRKNVELPDRESLDELIDRILAFAEHVRSQSAP
jgi:uncharacterized metal-binding protein